MRHSIMYPFDEGIIMLLLSALKSNAFCQRLLRTMPA